MKNDTQYFKPSTSSFMINFRAENLKELLLKLKKEVVTIAGEVKEY